MQVTTCQPISTRVLADLHVHSWHVFWPSNLELFLHPLAFLMFCPTRKGCQRVAVVKGPMTLHLKTLVWSLFKAWSTTPNTSRKIFYWIQLALDDFKVAKWNLSWKQALFCWAFSISRRHADTAIDLARLAIEEKTLNGGASFCH